MSKDKYPIEMYSLNRKDNPCVCFQVTRRIYFNNEATHREHTVFLAKENNTLDYVGFEGPNFSFYDECIAVWKIKKRKRSKELTIKTT